MKMDSQTGNFIGFSQENVLGKGFCPVNLLFYLPCKLFQLQKGGISIKMPRLIFLQSYLVGC